MIKFRAWDKKNEIYLYNIQDAHDTVWGLVKYDDGKIAEYDEPCFGDFLNNERYVVEQFTGLKDMNGKDIYEGDLVRLADDLDNPYKVIFDKAKFEFSGSRFCYDFGEAFMDYEVIGNVHTNPELLEEEK
ncbi:hypothetical protein [Lactobacillus phage Maenad]|uniref:YopX protein domain-containing protein n=1 Tax=Lactobacillus phage Maenad TaxID=2079431 RepID=A0A2P0ZKS9_9CAUD|nr:hypothetical protein HOS85_gp025 [Lactobacillus phage Maenad]AVH85599.1 hypothetical protein [Lactobacillus phage Maenad]